MRSKNSLATQCKALLYLLFPNEVINQLVEVDFQKELATNRGLASAPDEKKHLFRAELLNSTIDSAKLLRKRICISLIWVASACMLPIIVFAVSNKFQSSLLKAPSLLAISSVVVFAWATLGRLGWEGQTSVGDTVFEQLDKNLFWLQYWLGTILATLAFLT